MKIRTNYIFYSSSFSFFCTFSMIWNVASARDEISLRRWSAWWFYVFAHLQKEHWLQKMHFVGRNASFSLMCLYT